MKQPFAKYLENYAEPEVALLDADWFADRQYQNTIVIPAYDEPTDFLSKVTQQVEFNNAATLIICVINAPEESNDQEAYQRTVELYRHLCISGRCISASKDNRLRLIQPSSSRGFDLLLVDRVSPNNLIPARQGVGLARKLGNDLAAYLTGSKVITSGWIHNTDADALLPRAYLQTSIKTTSSAYYYPFIHVAEQGLELAMELYELSLHYYVLGLQWAGSPYAFHTIGSTLVISAAKYCQVRGTPKRSGGEDFHLLNKLAKVDMVSQVSSEPIIIQGRASARVPFGTGPALGEISTLEQPLEEYLFYNGAVFNALRVWLESFAKLWQINLKSPGYEADQLLELAIPDNGLSIDPSLVIGALRELGASDAIEHALRQGKSQDQFERQLNVWFDGLKTLQFIHALENAGMTRKNFAQIRNNQIIQSATNNKGWTEQRALRLLQALELRLGSGQGSQ